MLFNQFILYIILAFHEADTSRHFKGYITPLKLPQFDFLYLIWFWLVIDVGYFQMTFAFSSFWIARLTGDPNLNTYSMVMQSL